MLGCEETQIFDLGAESSWFENDSAEKISWNRFTHVTRGLKGILSGSITDPDLVSSEKKKNFMISGFCQKAGDKATVVGIVFRFEVCLNTW